MELLKKIGTFFLDIIETIVIALAIFVVVYLFLVQPHQVKGQSMFPKFHDGEYILTNKVSYRFHPPERGDVVVFKSPNNAEVDFIKRIIGVSGETVKIMNGKVFVNGIELDENNYLPSDYVTNAGAFARENQDLLVPEGEYFVLGDNRSHSSDSREWGFVPFKDIVGKAWFRYWPINRLGIVPHEKYSL